MKTTAETVVKNLHFELDEDEEKIIHDFCTLAYRVVKSAEQKGLDIRAHDYDEETLCDGDYNLFIASRTCLDVMGIRY